MEHLAHGDPIPSMTCYERPSKINYDRIARMLGCHCFFTEGGRLVIANGVDSIARPSRCRLEPEGRPDHALADKKTHVELEVFQVCATTDTVTRTPKA